MNAPKSVVWPSYSWLPDAPDATATDDVVCERCGELLPDGETAYIRRGQVWCLDCNRRWPPWSATAPQTWQSKPHRIHHGRD